MITVLKLMVERGILSNWRCINSFVAVILTTIEISLEGKDETQKNRNLRHSL